MPTSKDIDPPKGPSQGIPAGWYDDPEVSGQRRYWDGSRWTQHRAPGAGAAPGPPPPATAPGAPQQRRPWYRSPGPWLAIGAGILVVAVGIAVLVSQVSTGTSRADASAEFNKFEKTLSSVHNSAVVEGQQLLRCWNSSGSPEVAAARCGPSCVSCTRTAKAGSKRLTEAYQQSPGYVQDVYGEFYRLETRHLAVVAAWGALTKRALDAVTRGDPGAFYQYQAQSIGLSVRVQRIEAQLHRVARRTRAKRERYLDGL